MRRHGMSVRRRGMAKKEEKKEYEYKTAAIEAEKEIGELAVAMNEWRKQRDQWSVIRRGWVKERLRRRCQAILWMV